MRNIRIAASQYPIDLLASFAEWENKLSLWVEQAAAARVNLAVFPEYAAMELAGLDLERARDLAASLELVMALGEAYDEAHAALARRHDLMILAGSRPARTRDGRIVNRARLFCPDGTTGHQDKIMMTRFERERWGISGGDSINAIRTPFGEIGISICYDVEFPYIARTQAEAGARLILAPSATDSRQGYWRVRIGAQARALENQCYVVQAPTVGDSQWLPYLDENHGAAGVFGPPDGIIPDDGVVTSGRLNHSGWVMADVDLDMVDHWRRDGTVLPFRDWNEQQAPFHVVENVPGSEVLAQLALSAETQDSSDLMAPAAPTLIL